jgi:DNA polymerase-3 subunit epsilon
MKILFFDTETTGVDPKVNAVHQFTGALEIDGKIVEEFDYHIRPFEDAVIEPEALAVGGVTLEQIMAYDLPATVYARFVTTLDEHCDRYSKKDKIFLCGYNNASFDNAFLRAMFERNYNKYFGSYFWSSPLDVFIMASFKLMKVRQWLPDFKQGTVAKALGIEVDDSQLHSAKYDLWVLMEIYKKLI